MVTQKSRFFLVFFGLVGSFIDWFSLHSITQTLFICEGVSHSYVQSDAASQNKLITQFNLSINHFEVGQSDIKSGSHSMSHFMFSHCQGVSHFMFSICQSVRQSFYVQYLSVSQSVCQSVILCSVSVRSVSQSVILCSVSVGQSVILCSVSLSQSVS